MFKLQKTDNNNVTLYLAIINGINMLTGNPAKALKFETAKAANNYKNNLTHPNLQGLQVSL